MNQLATLKFNSLDKLTPECYYSKYRRRYSYLNVSTERKNLRLVHFPVNKIKALS